MFQRFIGGGLILVISIILFSGCGTSTNNTNNISNSTESNNSNVNVNSATISVQVVLSDGDNQSSYSVLVKPASSVDSVMQQVSKEYQFSYRTQESTSAGKYVEEINGQASDTAANKFWLYDINGTPATTGVADTIVKANDVITWKYQAF
ncbi:MAG: DUF4430 domain-containing protein [Patescibacteria group bacterium]|jgi:hypothetical protein